MISKDEAETERIADSLQQIGQALDQYLKFEHPDAFKNKEQWQWQSPDRQMPIQILSCSLNPNYPSVALDIFLTR